MIFVLRYFPFHVEYLSLHSQDFVVNNNTFVSVKESVYLGALINYENKVEYSNGNGTGYFCYVSSLNPLHLKKSKVKLCKLMVHPVITYGTETRVLKFTYEPHLKLLERKIICKISGAMYENGNWGIRSNLGMKTLMALLNL